LSVGSCKGSKTKENKKMHFMILDVTNIQNVHGSKKLISKTSKMGGNYMVKKYL